jgi:hypothetical protein
VSAGTAPGAQGRWFHLDPRRRDGQAESVPRLPAPEAGAAEDREARLERLRREMAGREARLAFLRWQAEALERLRGTGPPPAPAGEPFWSPVPLVGFRTWRPTPQGMRGVVQVWPGPRLEAACLRGPGAPHEVPGCRCGIYAFKEAEALGAVGVGDRPGAVYGLASLTGRVIEHERGYRAQRAEVLAVALVSDGKLVYGCDTRWIARLFTPGIGGAVAGAVAGGRVGFPGLSGLGVEYLQEQARRFRAQWT